MGHILKHIHTLLSVGVYKKIKIEYLKCRGLGFAAMACVLKVLYGLVTGANTIKYAILGLVVCGLAYAMIIVLSAVVLAKAN